MSFGRRLRLFFVGIVAIPIVLAVLVGMADAGIGAGLDTGRAVYEQALSSAPDEAKRIAQRAGPDLAAGDRAALAAHRRAHRDLEPSSTIGSSGRWRG